jgi:hypothetical protein
MGLLEYHDARIFGRIWVKEVGGRCEDRSIYTFSVQAICADFQNLLETSGDTGFVIADSRSPAPNAAVAHSVFTQKFKTEGDRYPRILEMPTFGHSQNHAGLQVAVKDHRNSSELLMRIPHLVVCATGCVSGFFEAVA